MTKVIKNMKKMTRELIRVADQLDRLGLSELADSMDKLVEASIDRPWQDTVKRALEDSNYEEIEVEIPEEEREVLKEVLESLQRSLE